MTSTVLHRPASTDGAGSLVAPGAAVLVVDDEPSLRTLLVRLLERRGCEAVEAASAAAALERHRERSFDAVVSDYALGGPTGLDLLLRTRFELGPGETFVLMSSAFPPGIERRAQL